MVNRNDAKTYCVTTDSPNVHSSVKADRPWEKISKGLNTKIWREVPKVNLPVIHDLNNGKILQPQFFITSIVPEDYMVSWYQWLVFFLQLIAVT
jgi:hypothetical protein